MIRTITFIFALFTSVAQSADFKEGAMLYANNNFEAAIKIFKPLAEQGHVKAQYALGSMYQLGLGVPEDFDQAEFWSRKAAIRGFALAQYDLASLYLSTKQFKLAYMWLVFALRNDVPDAKSTLNDLRLIMTKQEMEEAEHMFLKCLESNFKDCN
ncbi:tetratricopeptide repeat protein [Thalassotalea maritima]|uniref:tetratricopeptide repeat protein n=1 Tax=Thalassotalea maritima TaxID=3242416 RepID=UPI00352892D6